jgi:hypothetical protein
MFVLALKALDVGFNIKALDLPKDADVFGIVLVPFAITFLSILLLALNRPIVRTLEGYGKLNPFKLLLRGRQRIYAEKIKPLLEGKKRLEEARRTNRAAESEIPDFAARLYEAVQSYPDEAEHVLPTSFGNVMRAFEVYSRVVYGLESVQGWNRLQLLLPKQVAEQVRDSRAMLDFIVNILALAVAILVIYAVAAWRAHALPVQVVPLAAALSAVLAWSYLPDAAMQWGETVKSVFDVQRHRLARDHGLEIPPDPAEEAEMWHAASVMMTYRSHEAFTSLGKYRRKKRSRSRPAATESERKA